MIQQKHLEEIWKELNYSGQSEFEFKRIDSKAIPEIHIGLNSKFNRCLLLELPQNHTVDFQTVVKKNLTLHFFAKSNYIVLELTDSSFFDLFDDLILSIYSHIYQLDEVDVYANIFIQIFYKWSEFFEEKESHKLSLESIKGIWGELFVLKGLIEESNSFKINEILNSWRGLYDEAHDFVLDEKDIEVKTKDLSHLSVKISSEYQLEEELDKSLELWVLSVEIDFIKGKSISTLIEEIKLLVVNKMGDFSIVLTALLQKNILMSNIHQYDNYRFLEKEKLIFDCTHKDFPKLTQGNTSKAISNIRYKLQLSYLSDYLVSKESFNE